MFILINLWLVLNTLSIYHVHHFLQFSLELAYTCLMKKGEKVCLYMCVYNDRHNTDIIWRIIYSISQYQSILYSILSKAGFFDKLVVV